MPTIDVISRNVVMNSASRITPVDAHGAGSGRPSVVAATASAGKIARHSAVDLFAVIQE